MALTNLMTAITLDVYDHNAAQTSIKSISCDSNTRYVRAALTYAHVPYKVSVNATVTLTVVRPDDAAVNIEGETYNSGAEATDRIVAELTDVATAVKGSLLAQFKIEDGNQVLRTEVFKIDNGVALDIDSDKWADTYQGYDLSEFDRKLTTVSTEFDNLRTAKISDIGKALVAKAVAGGKVTSWEFKDVNSGGGSGSGGEGGSGQDGISPVVTVTDITGGHRVTIDDAEGTHSFDVMDGAKGAKGDPGSNGFSPTVSVTNITGGHRVSITDVTGAKTFDVMDGAGGSGGGSSNEVYYVTPEDYGAVGDGSTNDTNAMSQAFNSGHPVVLTQGKTYFVQQLTVTHPLLLIGNNATIATRSITIEEYNNGGQRMFIFDDSATEVYIKDVNFYTTADQTVYGAHGDRDDPIPNRSIRCAIAAYGVDKLSVVNCTFTNFDTPINGQRHGSDTNYEYIANNFYLKDCRIHNSLMGVIGYFHHIVVDGCEIIEDANARSGEHCLYFLIDVLDTAVIANSSFYTHDGDCGSCIQFYIPNTTSTLPTGIKREYRIDGCQFFGDAFISNSGGGKCYASACTMKAINYRTANRRRQFECAITDGGVIEVTDSVVNLELQDRIDQALVFRNCNVYSTRLLSDRFALYKAYGCQFDNISFRVANDAEIINCVFSSSVSVLGKYYFTVPSTTTASSIVDCIFNTGSNVSSIAYGCVGTCNLVSAISELPVGTDNPGLIVIHKVDSTGSSDSGGSSSGSGSKILFDGTANIVADTVNYVALNDISTTIEVGDTYRVTWNGIASTLTAKSIEINGNTIVAIGNPGTDGGTDDGSGLTYCGYKYSATVLAFSTTEPAGKITLKVEKIVGEDTSVYGNAIFIGDSICLGYNNNNISFVDVLSKRNLFSSVSKIAAIGLSTSTFPTYAAEIPTATWETANIVFLCIESDDAVSEREIGAIADTTASTVSGSVSVINNYIRNLNPTCTIVWLTFTKTNWRRYESFVAQAWLKKWALIAMQKAHALGMREIPFYDILNDDLLAADKRHPNLAGHTLIANLIQQNPYGDCDPVLIWPEIEPTVLFDGTATIRTGSDGKNYTVLSNVTDTMSVGDKYRVTWNGTTSVLTAKTVTVDNSSDIVIGNPGVEYPSLDDGSSLTYYGYRYSATAMAFGTSDSTGTINIKVEKLAEWG